MSKSQMTASMTDGWIDVGEDSASQRETGDRPGRPRSSKAARPFVRRQLMRTCELDTAAMVMIWKHWLG